MLPFSISMCAEIAAPRLVSWRQLFSATSARSARSMTSPSCCSSRCNSATSSPRVSEVLNCGLVVPSCFVLCFSNSTYITSCEFVMSCRNTVVGSMANQVALIRRGATGRLCPTDAVLGFDLIAAFCVRLCHIHALSKRSKGPSRCHWPHLIVSRETVKSYPDRHATNCAGQLVAKLRA
jgi:hypothetical protein